MDSFLVGRNGGGLPESGAGVHGLYDRLPLAKPLRIHPRAKGNHFASDPESDQGARRPAGQGTLGLRRIGNGRPFRLPGTGRFGTMVSVLRKREPGVRFQRPEGQKDRRQWRSSGPGQRFSPIVTEGVPWRYGNATMSGSGSMRPSISSAGDAWRRETGRSSRGH